MPRHHAGPPPKRKPGANGSGNPEASATRATVTVATLSVAAPVMPNPRESTLTWVLLGILWIGGSWLRLRNVGPALLFGDELHSLRDMQGGYLQTISQFSETGAGLALPLLQKILIDLFGDGHWSLRAPAWLAGLLLLFGVYPLVKRHLGRTTALLATAWVAIDPLLVFYAHFGRIYSLVALLALVLWHQLEIILSSERVGAGRLFTLALCTAILPWAHPTALGFVLPIYGAALVAASNAAGQTPAQRRHRLGQLGSALALGGALCVLVYLPAFESLLKFIGNKTSADYYGDFGLVDILTLTTGSRPGAWAMLLVAGASTGLLLQQRGTRGGPLVMAVLGPFLVLALVQPYGDAYAYARYTLPAVAPVGILMAAGLGEALAPLGQHARRLTRGVGLAALMALWLAGPLCPGAIPSVPQHANTYLSLLGLPAFDAAWPDTPEFYLRLGQRPEAERENLRVIELPALTNRTRHLYRNYQLQHGTDTVLALLPAEFPRLPRGPYVSLNQSDWMERADADYLIVHLNVAEEVARYWSWLYGTSGPGPFAPATEAHMERHAHYGFPGTRVGPEWRRMLSQSLGEPVYLDPTIEVWQLRGPTSP